MENVRIQPDLVLAAKSRFRAYSSAPGSEWALAPFVAGAERGLMLSTAGTV